MSSPKTCLSLHSPSLSPHHHSTPTQGFMGLSHVALNMSLMWTGMRVGFAFLLMGSISSNMCPIDVVSRADLPTLSAELNSLGNVVSKSTPCKRAKSLCMKELMKEKSPGGKRLTTGANSNRNGAHYVILFGGCQRGGNRTGHEDISSKVFTQCLLYPLSVGIALVPAGISAASSRKASSTALPHYLLFQAWTFPFST